MHQFRKNFSWLLLCYLVAAPVFAVDATTELLAQKGVISAEEYEKIRKAQSSQAIVDLSEGLKIVCTNYMEYHW